MTSTIRFLTSPDIEYVVLEISFNPSSRTSVTTTALAAAGSPPIIATYQGIFSAFQPY